MLLDRGVDVLRPNSKGRTITELLHMEGRTNLESALRASKERLAQVKHAASDDEGDAELDLEVVLEEVKRSQRQSIKKLRKKHTLRLNDAQQRLENEIQLRQEQTIQMEEMKRRIQEMQQGMDRMQDMKETIERMELERTINRKKIDQMERMRKRIEELEELRLKVDQMEELKKKIQELEEERDTMRGDKVDHLDLNQIDNFIRLHSKIITKLTNAKKELDRCNICMDGPIEMVIVPCGHRRFCQPCSQDKAVKVCPICRGPIASLIKTR
eukprot:TRINITY_DN3675_c0_g1_i1.p1 TRINITY_DN3675_c0_g1~~TRINITY_DN3675_c0_g1_i1.p1  ORF type:complete len:270 (+),score=57.54 TRINITY_DN3675_c0_g1_i1:295-1104(+)